MGVFTLTITESDSITDEYTKTLKLLIFMLYYAYFKQMYGNPINEHLFDQINTIEDSPSFNITILKILKGIMNTSYDNESLISDIANKILNALNKELDFSSIIDEFLGYLKLYITEQEDIIKYEEDKIKLTQNLHFEEYNYITLALASINYYIDTENNYLLSMLQFNSTIKQNYAFEKELIPKIDTDTTLLPYTLTASASASASAAAIVTATASATFDNDESYTKEHVDFLLKDEIMLDTFLKNIRNPNFTEEITDFITYIKLAEYIVNSNETALEQYLEDSESYLSKARMYADDILAKIPVKEREKEENFDNIHKASAIILAIKDTRQITDDFKAKYELQQQALLASLTDDAIFKTINREVDIQFKPSGISFNTQIQTKGYTPKFDDRGGGGDCFYFSVWGGLIDLGKPDYDIITGRLKKLGDNIKTDFVDFTNTFTDMSSKTYEEDKKNSNPKTIQYRDRRNKFNINIRKLLALYMLIDKHWYKIISDFYRAAGIESLEEFNREYIKKVKEILLKEGKELELYEHTQFISNTNNEHNIILSNIVLKPTLFADQIQYDSLKVLLSNCDVIMDRYSPLDFNIAKLPKKVENTFYIYIMKLEGEHYNQIKTVDDEQECTFIRRGKSDGYAPHNSWELVKIL